MNPFSKSDSYDTFLDHRKQVVDEIRSLDNEYVLKVALTELEDYYLDKVQIDPLVLHADQCYIETQEPTQIDVSRDFRRMVPHGGERAIVQGTRLEVCIPFEGDASLWKVRPSTFSTGGYPDIEIKANHVYIEFSFPDDSVDPQRLRSEIDRQVESLTDSVGYLANDVSKHNTTGEREVRAAIERKRDLAKSTVSAVASLGIPIKRRDEPATFTVPVKRRKNPAKPLAKQEPYEPAPVLDEKEYQHILKVLRGTALVIERSPRAFVTLDEEAIRTHFLIQLNGHYEGSATGETFNVSGKTDILIRVENKNIFIAECKFWKGPKAFDGAVTQLLGYLSWRDTKVALLVFNKTKNSTEVRSKMHEAMEARVEHRRTVNHEQAGDSRYVFSMPGDEGGELTVTTQVYDVPDA